MIRGRRRIFPIFPAVEAGSCPRYSRLCRLALLRQSSTSMRLYPMPAHALICPKQQAGVAVGIEPIAAVDGVRIGAPHHVETAEGADQHEQSRARQVEIGQHGVDGAEAVARRDEQRRLAAIGRERAVLGGRAFDQPQRGRADRDDAAAGAPRGVQRRRRLGAHATPFRMHAMAGRCRRP